MTALIKPEVATELNPLEIDSLARLLSSAFVRARDAERQGSKDPRIRYARSDPSVLMEAAVENIQWHEIAYAEDDIAGSAARILARLAHVARQELENGSRAAEVVAAELGPWARARFQELLRSFIEEYQPQGGIQIRMVEMLAQNYTAYELWMSFLPAAVVDYQSGQLYGVVFDRFERAAAMADRFMRLFLRVQRHLRDLRRFAPPVMINNPQQVNIASDGSQQVNVNLTES